MDLITFIKEATTMNQGFFYHAIGGIILEGINLYNNYICFNSVPASRIFITSTILKGGFMDWTQIIVLVFTALSFFFGGKLIQVFKALKELGEAIVVTGQAYDDGKITAEEVAAAMKEWGEAISEIKKLFSFKKLTIKK